LLSRRQFANKSGTYHVSQDFRVIDLVHLLEQIRGQRQPQLLNPDTELLDFLAEGIGFNRVPDSGFD
jgi:hypothetical protein